VDTTYYLLGTGAGPHPYPTMVREFQKIIGLEARNQILSKKINCLMLWLLALVVDQMH